MGAVLRQWNAVRPAAVRVPASSPLETAVSPDGTDTVTSKAALSEGWSLPGNHAMEPTGSPSARAPSSVRNQPSCEPSGSVSSQGTPA